MKHKVNTWSLRLMVSLLTIVAPALAQDGRILKRSDVVFMYQADQQTYADYGASVLAWGGKPTAKSLAAAQGVTFFGSVGMITEFRRYYERFPETYAQGLCRDINGQPVEVPWLTDHQHRGIPYWWCCTAQPQFRQYLRERVMETVQAGADGIHIDDHMGSAGGLWLGLCFCNRCVNGFRDYLKSLPAEKLQALGVRQPDRFDYRQVVKKWISAGDGQQQRRVTQHPLWPQWTIYQCRAAAAWMQQLRELAVRTAGRDVPFGANAGLLWPRHLSDFKTRDLSACKTLLIPDQENLLPADQKLVKERMAKGGCFEQISEALAQITPAVRVAAQGQLRALARVKPGSAVVHLLNHQYDAERDNVQPLQDLGVSVNLSQLGVTGVMNCRWVMPAAEPIVLPLNHHKVKVPTLGLWGLLVFQEP